MSAKGSFLEGISLDILQHYLRRTLHFKHMNISDNRKYHKVKPSHTDMLFAPAYFSALVIELQGV